MLYEQAFVSLPEFLTGLPYQNFDYERTLLSAFSMAVLQELNGRNINNPISCLRSEVEYPAAPGKRADLRLDLGAMKIMTPALSQYGIFQDNWLEAKYFKLNDNGRPTVDKLKVTLLLLKDIIRLVTLLPETIGQPSQCGRYLLHAYQGLPKEHIAEKKNTQNGKSGFTRSWVKSIRTTGRQQIGNVHAQQEVGQFDIVIGANLRQLQLEFEATTFAYEPRTDDSTVYWCYLTRIDDFKVTLGQYWLQRKGDQLTESGANAYNTLVESIVAGLAV
ncbi:MAG: hypothetical protein PHT19_10715 [Methylococcus sp.]|nr:hypothetical protein [Methylococcus sp.]